MPKAKIKPETEAKLLRLALELRNDGDHTEYLIEYIDEKIPAYLELVDRVTGVKAEAEWPMLKKLNDHITLILESKDPVPDDDFCAHEELVGSFIWCNTEEGHDFWYQISKQVDTP